MSRYSVSLRKAFGDVSVRGDTKDEVLSSLTELVELADQIENKLQGKVRGTLLSLGSEQGPELNIPDSVLEKVSRFKNWQKIGVILHYTGEPLTKAEMMSKGPDLGIEEGWWHGGNFTRDVSKIVTTNKREDGKTVYRLKDIAKLQFKKLIEDGE